jgi:hypothetical protein
LRAVKHSKNKIFDLRRSIASNEPNHQEIMVSTSISSKPGGCPWQLYLFSTLHLCGIFALFFDVCSFLTGSGQACTSVEHITALMLGLTFVWVGVFFAVLTYRCHVHEDASSKLKRLAMLATDCSAALFAGVVMTGSTKFGGFERGSFHLLDMLFFFALYLVMQSETHSDGVLPAKSTPLKTGLAFFNCKALLLVLLVVMTLKIFFMSDMMSVDYLFEESDDEKHVTTALARFFWDWSIIILFEAVLATAFVLYYGDFYDQEAVVMAMAAMEVVSFCYTIPIWSDVRADLLMTSLISMLVFIALCVVVIYVGRKQQQRSGYEPVVSTNV